MPAKAHLTNVPKPGANVQLSIEAAISRHPFLAGLSPHHLRLLSDCAMPARFTAGELIFKEGDPANRFYLIQKGKVALECRTKDNAETLIQIIGSGDAEMQNRLDAFKEKLAAESRAKNSKLAG